MKKVLPLLVLATVLPIGATEIPSTRSTASVVGYSSLQVLPDAATVHFEARIHSGDASDLYQKANRLLAELTRKLRKTGIKQPLTESFQPSITAEYSYYDNSSSYTYSIRLSVLLDNLSRMNELMEVLPMTYYEGVDLYIVPSVINYSLKDPAPYLAELRKRALENARLQAEQLAELQGKTVGELVDVRENERYSISMGVRNHNIYYGLWGYNVEDTGGHSPLPRLLMEYEITATYELVE